MQLLNEFPEVTRAYNFIGRENPSALAQMQYDDRFIGYRVDGFEERSAELMQPMVKDTKAYTPSHLPDLIIGRPANLMIWVSNEHNKANPVAGATSLSGAVSMINEEGSLQPMKNLFMFGHSFRENEPWKDISASVNYAA